MEGKRSKSVTDFESKLHKWDKFFSKKYYCANIHIIHGEAYRLAIKGVKLDKSTFNDLWSKEHFKNLKRYTKIMRDLRL